MAFSVLRPIPWIKLNEGIESIFFQLFAIWIIIHVYFQTIMQYIIRNYEEWKLSENGIRVGSVRGEHCERGGRLRRGKCNEDTHVSTKQKQVCMNKLGWNRTYPYSN